MKIGTLYSSVTLDRESRIYTSPSDPVSGHVVLEFKAWDREKGETSTTELHGPLKINVVFEGNLSTSIDEDNTVRNVGMPDYGDVRSLFHKTHFVYEGQLRAAANERKAFPFTLFFPERAMPTPQQRKNGITEDRWDALPPSLKVDFAGMYGIGTALVDYQIKVQVETPGIEVDVASRGVLPALKYRPLLPEDVVPSPTGSFEQAFSVTSEEFIPHSERPQGFRAKAKALLKDVEPPTYAFDLLWAGLPEFVRPEQPIAFKVGLRTNVDRTTATSIPEVTIQDSSVTVLGFCGVRVMPKYESPKDAAEVKDANDFTLPISINPHGPFDKENDYTKALLTKPLPYLPCSFAIERLSRYYKVRINLTLMVGGQKVNARREFPVTVLSPMQDDNNGDSDTTTPAGSSNMDTEQLPAYS